MKNIAVIGAGLSGLVCSWFIKDINPDVNVTVFEADKKGGQISTIPHEDLNIESGPAFLPLENPIIPYILSRAGAAGLVKIKDTQFHVIKDTYYQKSPGGFMQFENGALSFLSGGLPAILGMKKKIPVWENLTFFDFLKAAYGQTYAETMGSIFARAVYYCEAEDLNFQSASPELYNELKLGKSLKETVQNLSRKKQDKWSTLASESSQKFEAGYYAFKGGLGKLVDIIYDDLKKKNVHFEFSKISEISQHKGEHFLHTKGHKSGPFDTVIMSASAHDQVHIWKPLKKEISAQLAELKYRQVSYIYSCYNMKEFNRSGLGFLAPRKEKLTLSGAYYVNSFDPEPEKAGKFLTRTVIPGDLSLFNDEELVDIQERDFEKVYGLKTKPLWSKVFRHENARPVLDKNYIAWRKSIFDAMEEFPGIKLTGKDIASGDLNLTLENAFEIAKNVC